MNKIANIIGRSAVTIVAVVAMCFAHQAMAQQQQPKARNLDELLRLVEQGRIGEGAENRAREQRFQQQQDRQQQLLTEAKEERKREEERSERLEKRFADNQIIIADRRKQLTEALGSLTELFGHLTAAAGDLRSDLEVALSSAQFEGRPEFLQTLIEKISESDELPSIREVEHMWFEMQREITESGKVVRFETEVIDPKGQRASEEVVRIGSFNIVDTEGNYLSWVSGKQQLERLARQPAGPFQYWARSVAAAEGEELRPFGIDPTGPSGGSFLASLIDAPTLVERWHQGGVIGYLITAVGAFALLLALWRMGYLYLVGTRVGRQLRAPKKAKSDNPLGRILGVYQEHRNLETDALELKVSEAIIHERPKLEMGHALLKIIAAVAPLMGLLGTVTGMILTFQGIVIFGAGDPKAMAGGISQALMTTVLGLCVAIPTVLLHTVVNGRSNRILNILEEQSTGMIARQAEASGSAAKAN